MRRERPCVRVYVADLHRTPNLPLCVARCDLVPPGPVAGANPPDATTFAIEVVICSAP